MLYFYKVVYLYRTYSVLYVTNYAHKKNIFDQIKNTKNPKNKSWYVSNTNIVCYGNFFKPQLTRF